MDAIGSLMRENNMKLFLSVGETRTLKSAAKSSGVAYSHARRLVKCWEREGFVTRQMLSVHKDQILLTEKGLLLFVVAEDFLKAVKEVRGWK